jgi:dolichol kinase
MCVAMSVFIVVELLRALQVLSMLKTWIDRYYAPFRDGKDEGMLVLSHIYLLLGCALPVWIEQLSSEQCRF